MEDQVILQTLAEAEAITMGPTVTFSETPEIDLSSLGSGDFDPYMLLNVKYLPGAHELEQTSRGSWIDLYVYEDTFIAKGEQVYVNLGVAIELPEGYEAIIAPRSSTFKNWGLIQTNSIGVVDNSYNGDNDIWKCPMYAVREGVTIPKDTRICQFRIQNEQGKVQFNSVDSLENEDRGGFGSSGL